MHSRDKNILYSIVKKRCVQSQCVAKIWIFLSCVAKYLKLILFMKAFAFCCCQKLSSTNKKLGLKSSILINFWLTLILLLLSHQPICGKLRKLNQKPPHNEHPTLCRCSSGYVSRLIRKREFCSRVVKAYVASSLTQLKPIEVARFYDVSFLRLWKIAQLTKFPKPRSILLTYKLVVYNFKLRWMLADIKNDFDSLLELRELRTLPGKKPKRFLWAKGHLNNLIFSKACTWLEPGNGFSERRTRNGEEKAKGNFS